MGQKVNPHGLRMGVIKEWDARWYAEKDFADLLVEDNKLRTYIKDKLYTAGVSRIEIEKREKLNCRITKPGIVIGQADLY